MMHALMVKRDLERIFTFRQHAILAQFNVAAREPIAVRLTAYNSCDHAGSHHRLAHRPSSQDHQLHARQHGLPGAVRAGRSVLGRPAGHRRGGGGRHQRQPVVRGARDLADARRRHDHGGLACRRAQGARAGHLPVQPVAGPVDGRGRGVPRGRHVLPHRLRRGAQRRRRHAGADRGIPAVVHSRHGAAVCDRRHGRGAARHRQLQAGHDRADRHGDHQHRAGAGADLRLGAVPGDGRQRRGRRHVRRDRRRRRRGSRSTSSIATPTCAFTLPTGRRSSRCGGRC